MTARILSLISGLLLTALCLAAPAAADDAAALLKQGDDAWVLRSAGDAHVQDAIAAYEKAAAAAPQDATPLYEIARAYYFLGRFAAKAQKKDLFLKGVEAAKKALAANAASAGAHYWYAACLAKSVENESTMTKLKFKGDMEKHLERAHALDPSFYYGGPDRVIGMILYKSPVASNSDAIVHLRASLRFDPEYSLTLVSLAEVLVAVKQYDEAKRVCQKTLGLKPRPGFEKELADDQALALKLLAAMP
jgi:tetratricopeptide (TPR) repeat protein